MNDRATERAHPESRSLLATVFHEIPDPVTALRPLAVMMVLAALVAGCAADWRSSTYDPRRACQSFGGSYWESDGTCRSGGP